MQKIMIKLSAFIILFTASCTTIPGPIEDKYLAEKSTPESQKIEQLETKIISKHKEKKDSDSSLKAIKSNVQILEDEIKLLEKENDLFKDQHELYIKTKDARNAEIKKKQISENETKLKSKKSELKYKNTEMILKETTAKVKNIELAVSVADMNYLKSKIAESYRERNEPKKVEESRFKFLDKIFKKDKTDPYGYKKYKTYLDKQKIELIKATKKQKKAEVDFNAAEKEFKGLK